MGEVIFVKVGVEGIDRFRRINELDAFLLRGKHRIKDGKVQEETEQRY